MNSKINDMVFQEDLLRRTQQAETVIRSCLPKEQGMGERLAQAMNYSVTSPGKRLRPVLMRAMYGCYGGSGIVVEPFMAAIEMIHAHSLVHDDLPALDNDLLRRGVPTTHAKYGEALGILAGDALLNFAYETALLALEHGEAATVGRALQILADKTGIYGMLGGQALDVCQEESCCTREQLDYIYANKTSALIEAAMMVGAVLAGADEDDVFKIESIGYRVGVAFQIRDDILDVTSTTEQLGKPVYSDEKNEKVTYVTLMGIKQASSQVDKLAGEACEILSELSGLDAEEKSFVEALICYLTNREN